MAPMTVPTMSPARVSMPTTGRLQAGSMMPGPSRRSMTPNAPPVTAVSCQASPRLQLVRSPSGPALLTPTAQEAEAAPAVQVPVPVAVVAPQAPPQSNASGLEPWLTVEAQQQRRANLHLTEPAVENWIEECEFISLGCYCGVSRSLQCLGLKRFSYPFDWVRSPVFGLTHCLENHFSDFLSWTVLQNEGPHGKFWGSSAWGGSFWHHDPSSPEVHEEFTRRVERLYGMRDFPADRTRVFVRAVNSTRELEDSIRLRDSLMRAFPVAKIYLLILVDLQVDVGPFCLQNDDHCNLLFYRISDAVFADQWTMQKQGEAYAEAIAFAACLWAGQSNWSSLPSVPDLKKLTEVVTHFDGGSCANELFYPRRFGGQQIRIQKPDFVQPRSPQTQGRLPFASGSPQGVHVIPVPVETELQWRPPASPYGSRTSSLAPPGPPGCKAAADLLHHGVISPTLTPAAVHHEMAWTPWTPGQATAPGSLPTLLGRRGPEAKDSGLKPAHAATQAFLSPPPSPHRC
mmetsp:Transcript_27125/g.51034  ORF Transcript_27125/g.51034 Transcript_27125/m.51034 type:complete len:514 (+) Transcript_27125:66-1607(+)